MSEAILAGLILGFALIFSVGPVVFTIIKLRINYGISSALCFISGVWISDFLWIILANFFSNLLSALITFKFSIGIFGGLFLIGLSIFYLFFKKYPTEDGLNKGIKINNATYVKLFFTGLAINSLNPAVISLWFAATTKALSYSFEERITLFAVCLFLNISSDIFKINIAGKIRKKMTEKNIRIINKISAILFFLFGLMLIISTCMSYVKK